MRLEANVPEGRVTEPVTVTTVPSGKLRASAMVIVLGDGGADRAASGATARRTVARATIGSVDAAWPNVGIVTRGIGSSPLRIRNANAETPAFERAGLARSAPGEGRSAGHRGALHEAL